MYWSCPRSYVNGAVLYPGNSLGTRFNPTLLSVPFPSFNTAIKNTDDTSISRYQHLSCLAAIIVPSLAGQQSLYPVLPGSSHCTQSCRAAVTVPSLAGQQSLYLVLPGSSHCTQSCWAAVTVPSLAGQQSLYPVLLGSSYCTQSCRAAVTLPSLAGQQSLYPVLPGSHHCTQSCQAAVTVPSLPRQPSLYLSPARQPSLYLVLPVVLWAKRILWAYIGGACIGGGRKEKWEGEKYVWFNLTGFVHRRNAITPKT